MLIAGPFDSESRVGLQRNTPQIILRLREVGAPGNLDESGGVIGQ